MIGGTSDRALLGSAAEVLQAVALHKPQSLQTYATSMPRAGLPFVLGARPSVDPAQVCA
jgi:hypothetical protein